MGMTFEEWLPLAEGMKCMYVQQSFLSTEEAVKMWYSLLNDIEYPVLSAAVRKHLMTNKYPPTVAEIREMCVTVKEPELPTWGEAWGTVIHSISRFGIYREDEALASFDEITRETVRNIGYQNICTGEEELSRANFRMIYEQLIQRRKKESAVSDDLKDLIGMIQHGNQGRIE